MRRTWKRSAGGGPVWPKLSRVRRSPSEPEDAGATASLKTGMSGNSKAGNWGTALI